MAIHFIDKIHNITKNVNIIKNKTQHNNLNKVTSNGVYTISSKKMCKTIALFTMCFYLCGCSSDALNLDSVQNTSSTTNAQVTVLGIGKADCTVIQTTNSVVMIDTGTEEDFDTIADFLDENDITTINTLIITHFDKDHVGSAADIIENYSVESVYTTWYEAKESDEIDNFHDALDDADKEEILVEDTTTLDIDGITYTIYPPETDSYEANESNNSSLVILMSDGDTNILFAGDAQEERIAELLEIDGLSADIIKMPHHGGFEENLQELLKKISAKDAIITNVEEDVDDDTINLLDELSINTYITDENNVTISITADGYSINE